MNYLEVTGAVTLGFFAAIFGFTALYYLYRLLRAMVLSADFVRWYLAQSKLYDPTYRMKVSVVRAWLGQIPGMWNYGVYSNITVTMTHNNGATYRPFAKV